MSKALAIDSAATWWFPWEPARSPEPASGVFESPCKLDEPAYRLAVAELKDRRMQLARSELTFLEAGPNEWFEEGEIAAVRRAALRHGVDAVELFRQVRQENVAR
jgi:hypothetical protein